LRAEDWLATATWAVAQNWQWTALSSKPPEWLCATSSVMKNTKNTQTRVTNTRANLTEHDMAGSHKQAFAPASDFTMMLWNSNPVKLLQLTSNRDTRQSAGDECL
jgi:hypothetical protein